jgi:hypothetical protein
MISLLIPIYNFDVRGFVSALQSECQAGNFEFEILCVDDVSDEAHKVINREIAALQGVIYKELDQKMGRAAIRNLLAAAARFPLLLFMDCDAKVKTGDFVWQYLAASDGHSVICGGRSYEELPPKNKNLLLHWKYGRAKEQKSAFERSRNPWFGFMSNSFLIPAAIFQQVKFDEKFQHYGHEDTMFGLELRKKGIPVVHIDNPLDHIGLERAEVFLEKTRQGLDNLKIIEKFDSQGQTRLLKLWKWCRLTRLSFLLKLFFAATGSALLRNLQSEAPSLALFDLYKIGYFSAISDRREA